MAREWSELFITGEGGGGAAGGGGRDAEGAGAEGTGEAGATGRRGLFRRLRESMAKTRQALLKTGMKRLAVGGGVISAMSDFSDFSSAKRRPSVNLWGTLAPEARS